MRALGAEAIGTFALVFAGCGAIMVDATTHSLGHLGIAAAFGLVIMVMIYAVGHLSGAHFNPAVTAAFALGGHFPWPRVPGYWAAQVVGATAAALVLRAALGDVAGVGATVPSGSDVQALTFELVLSFLLMLVIAAVATDSRAVGEAAAIAVGATVGLDALIGGPISGASMNPARSLGPAIVAGQFASIWIYLVGPFVGTATAVVAYRWLGARSSTRTPAGRGRYDPDVHRHHSPTDLSSAAQEYLLALRVMAVDGSRVSAAQVGRHLGVSTQAASEMFRRLTADGLVAQAEGRELILTEAGRAAADGIFRRHALLEWLLTTVVGLGWAESDEEAARLQGAISPRVEARLDEMLGHPETCPHGNPIDAATARRRPPGVLLSSLEAGERATIYRITEEAEEDAALLSYLEARALTPGAPINVLARSESLDQITIEGPRGRATLGLRPAALIRALRGDADPKLFHHVPQR